MPILPLNHPEPFSATLGVMLYPDEADALKARAFAAQYLAEPMRRLYKAGGTLSHDIVCTENLNPDVVVMKPAKDRV